jgi:hypothetical protein
MHGLRRQSANGEAKPISEGALSTIRSNAVTADMSHGGCSPVSWFPIQAPQ